MDLKAILPILLIWGACTLGGVGCSTLLDPGMASLTEGIADIETRLAKGEELSEAARSGLETTLRGLKDRQKEIERDLVAKEGWSPETAAGATGLAGLLLTLGINYLGQRRKLRNTRSELFGRVVELEKKNGGAG